MAWMIGIDEAGYGPNLGPLVMTAIAWKVPDDLLAVNLWDHLQCDVCRQGDSTDGRIIVDDSKAVYGSGGTLRNLETSVAAVVAPWLAVQLSLADHVERTCPTSRPGLCGEAWYTGATVLPREANDELSCLIDRFAGTCRSSAIERGPVRSVVVCTPRFNALLDEWGSKGAVLAAALTELLRDFCRTLDGDDALHFFVDKHGGRNIYAPMLQDALEEGMVVVRQESAARSRYEVLDAPRPIHITFQPRADAEHFCVALASMASKYLRELFMLEFNHFWRQHIPNLKPTAGYPVDATRFLTAIRPAMHKLGLAESAIWRRR